MFALDNGRTIEVSKERTKEIKTERDRQIQKERRWSREKRMGGRVQELIQHFSMY